MNGIVDLIGRVIQWILLQLGLARPIKIAERCFMPLFVVLPPAGGVLATWDYLRYPRAVQSELRRRILEGAEDGETPAITFCLTPASVTGGLIADDMNAITDHELARLDKACFELLADGIAIFPCLYVDDHEPRWFHVDAHQHTWKAAGKILRKYASGYILSIETNEKAQNARHITTCVETMKDCFPGARYYGTHLQYKSGGRYSWTGANTPTSCNLVLMETNNNPQKDIPAAQVLREWQAANGAVVAGRINIVCHEYNLNVGSANHTAARAALRAGGAWGIG